MIITQTPLRISFLGGGTDLPAYCRDSPGAVLSCTIDKYIYATVQPRFDELLRVGYTRTEMVPSLRHVEHDLVREALHIAGVESGVEVSTMADIPSRGSGLGSSSSVTVGLLHALHLYRGRLPSRSQLADEASSIEIDVLRRPVGRQDQYAAAFGGLRYYEFRDRSVTVSDRLVSPDTHRRLSEHLMLFFTGVTRSSSSVLWGQARLVPERRPALARLVELAEEGWRLLLSGCSDGLGDLMHEAWMLKRTLAPGVTTSTIDAMYSAARNAGATGGKICGAGAGGFLLVHCAPESQAAVRAALAAYAELPFHLESSGSRTVMNVLRD